MHDDQTFGRWLQRRRKALDMTQEELAQRIGCSPITLYRIETNKRRPSKQIAERLAQQLGIAPDKHMTFIRFAREQAPLSELDHHCTTADPSAGTPGTFAPTNLPSQRTSFIGRDHEVRTACALLQRDQIRLLSFTGPGGIGKTRLSIQVAFALREHFPDGVFFIDLASLPDSTLIASTVAHVLKLREIGTEPVEEAIKSYLKRRTVLFIFDNFEHVLAGATFVTDILTQTPKIKAIVTSRVVLGVGGEFEFPVPALPLPNPRRMPPLHLLAESPAVALFTTRAQALVPDFALTAENAAVVAELCVRLEGIPLAIELAAVRTRLFSPAALLQRLSHRLALLTRGFPNAPLRHQSLRAVIAWSYELLSPRSSSSLRSWVSLWMDVLSKRSKPSVHL